MIKINTYTFYWLDGTREVLEGENLAGAYKNAGYGAGALRALDFTCNGNNNAYEWKEGKWVKKETES